MKIDLSGKWRYELDPMSKGVEAEWFTRKLAGEGFHLPGTTNSNQVGKTTNLEPAMNELALRCFRERYSYVGEAWYQREIMIPEEWQGKIVSLFLERILFESTVWIDGILVGKQDSLAVPHIYKVTSYIRNKEQITLTIKIDNRDIHGISSIYKFLGNETSIWNGLQAPHAYSQETQTIWNGIIGKMGLFAQDKVQIHDIQVYPDMDRGNALVKVTVKNQLGETVFSDIKVTILDNMAKKAAEVILGNQKIAGEETVFEAVCDLNNNLLTWDEFTPNLYCLEVDLVSVKANTSFHDRKVLQFGMRSFKAAGKYFKINNLKTMLRGTIDSCIFPLTGYPATDKEEWLRIFGIIKEYGFNHVRFHSWCPPENAFAAADEIGLYLSIESCLWLAVEPDYFVGSNAAHYDYFLKEAMRIIDTYGNHPSFCLFSNGNELRGDFTLLHNIIKAMREKDQRRLYTATTCWHEPLSQVENLDCYFSHRIGDKGYRGQYFLDKICEGSEFDYTAAMCMDMPMVTHEIGQYLVYPDIEEIESYEQGHLNAVNYKAIKKDLTDRGMLKNAKEFMLGSGKLAALLYKCELEALFRTTGSGGFQLLALNDFPGQGTSTVGLLTSYWESKGIIAKKEFREFCNAIVLLLRTGKKIYSPQDLFEGRIEISNFGPSDITDAVITWKIIHEEDMLAQGQFAGVSIEQGSVGHVGKLCGTYFKKISKPSQITLVLEMANMELRNHWTFFVYPSESANQVTALNSDTVVFNEFSVQVEKALQAGKKVLLIPGSKDLTHRYIGQFFPVFWNPVLFPSGNPCGIVCDTKHPAFHDFPVEKYLDIQWKALLERSISICIDTLPTDFAPIVQIIPNFYHNRRLTNLFEAKVGSGKLLVCSININDTSSSLEMQALRRSILAYLNSDNFAPQYQLSMADLQGIFKVQEAAFASLKDLARQKPCKADEARANYLAYKANDGDEVSCWATNDPHLDHWWQVDLQQIEYFNCIKLVFSGERKYSYFIEGSLDEENWHRLVDESESKLRNRVVEYEVAAKSRFLRITFKGAPFGSAPSINQFIVYNK